MKTKGKIQERDLLKALSELEETVEKSDALEDADPEGDLSTEGESLSSKAKKSVKKSVKKGMKPPADDESEDDASGEDDESEDDASGDDESEDDASPMGKSFRESAEDNEVISKSIEVSDFIEAMIDEVGAHLDTTRKSLAKSFTKALDEALSKMQAHFDARLASVQAQQVASSGRVAKALVAIGTSVNDQEDMLKSLGERPAGNARGKAVLSKSEIALPAFAGGGTGGNMADGSEDTDAAMLSEIPIAKIFDWMFEKSTSNQLDSRLITQFEADKDPEALPFQVRKALINDLCK